MKQKKHDEVSDLLFPLPPKKWLKENKKNLQLFFISLQHATAF
jgi:hypothetical protein